MTILVVAAAAISAAVPESTCMMLRFVEVLFVKRQRWVKHVGMLVNDDDDDDD